MINKYIDNLKTFFKNMHKKDNIDILIGITSILVALWVIIYAIPTLFASLFHTLLGNLILLLLVVFAGVINLQIGFISLIVVIILYQFSKYSYIKESFDQNNVNKPTGGWSKKTINDFMKYQYITFPNAIFNMDILQQQASEDEVKTLLKTGAWPWSQETQDIYINIVSRNEIVSANPGESLAQAMKLYNENAAKQLISWNTKEGNFLLRGVDLGAASSEPDFIQDKKHNSIKCVSDKNEISNSHIEKKTYLGTHYFTGLFKIKKERIENDDLPNVIPGFGFIKNSCNPCVALNETADYSCPFKINIKDNNTVSKMWANLWGL